MIEEPTPGDLRCSMCLAPRAEVQWLVQGGDVAICNDCIGDCNALLVSLAPDWKHGTPFPMPRRAWPHRRCSLCATNTAAQMIDSQKGAMTICDVCVVRCNDHLVESLRAIPGALEEIE